jgi:hypothetical protein
MESDEDDQETVCCSSSYPWKDPERNGAFAGRLGKIDTEFRTRMEKHPDPCRAADSFSSCGKAFCRQERHAMLGHSRVPGKHQKQMPCLGISSRPSLLVCQRNDLPGRDSIELEKQNEDLPEMRDLPKHFQEHRNSKRGVTDHSTAEWTADQILQTFPWIQLPVTCFAIGSASIRGIGPCEMRSASRNGVGPQQVESIPKITLGDPHKIEFALDFRCCFFVARSFRYGFRKAGRLS